ncbi:hypothetical protein [Aquiflexum lacus]|uniref:hypothetical protein n=1 Tax=Aquiflexum lacus TaxID=2483805 RepID=UPI001E407F48|nr:hypothetical protein [Aquiflexum lacus]
MSNDKILNVPMLERKWSKLAYFFFPFPVFLVIILKILQLSEVIGIEISGNDVAEITYSFWAIGFIILILTKEKEEDEMIKMFRLQAFQTGFYWLMWGLGVLILIHFFGKTDYSDISGPPISAALVMFLLSAYVFVAFKYQIWKASKEF